MEQKRTLWITAAVGLFLLVVLGAALILYAPASKPGMFSAVPGNISNQTSSNGWISLAPSTPAPGYSSSNYKEENNSSPFASESPEKPISEFRTDEVNIFADNANIFSDNAVVSTENASFPNVSASESKSETVPTIINNTTTIDLNPVIKEALAQAVPVKEKTSDVKQKEVANTKTQKTEKTVNAVSKKENTKEAVQVQKKEKALAVSSKVSNTKVSSKNTVKPTAEKTVPAITQYWIQVTALTSRKSADTAREILGENQINADVFTYSDSANRLFYRVRVGPYTTKSEAEYWRTKIARIETFKNTASYVTSTQVVQ